MKKSPLAVLSLLVFLMAGSSIHATTLSWANTNGGDWNIATNWTPAQVPASGDDVVITNSGTYLVTNNTTVTLGRLTLGGTNGIQTLSLASLSLTNTTTVNSNGVLNWNGGTLNGSLTVAQGGVLNISSNTTYTLFSALTNNGTVNWSAGNFSGYGPPTYSGLIYNAGLWNAQGDGSLNINSGTPAFVNVGTFRKSGGTNTTTINWNFTSTGIFDVQIGSLSSSSWVGTNILNGNYTGAITLTDTNTTLLVASNAVLHWNGGTISGKFSVAQGGVLNLTNNVTYTLLSSLTNNGTVNWSAGNISGYGPPTYNGLIYNAGLWNAQGDASLNINSGTPAFINVGTFRKSGGTGTTSIGWNFTSTGIFDVQIGSLSSSSWVGTNILNGNYTGAVSLTDTNTTLLVASNAVLRWNGGTINGKFTVAQGGVLNITNVSSYIIFSSLTNNGTVNWSAGNIQGYGPPTYNGVIYNAGLWDAQSDGSLNLNGGAPVFINVGTFRKSGGTNTTSIGWNFTSTGTIDTQTGSLSSSTWVGNSILNGKYTGDASLAANATLLLASNAVLNWKSGEIDGALTMAQGGVLNMTNSATYYVFGSLTNNGTVNWSAGTIYGYGPPNYHGLIYNAGLWDVQFDGSMIANNGTPAFINTGTFRKSGGSGAVAITWNFTSTGTFDIQTGSLSASAWVGNNTLNGNYKGTINVNTNTTVTVPANVTVNWTGGTIANGGSLNISSNGVINWGGGEIDGALTVAQGGILNITNSSTYYFFGSLTNNGTVNWSAGTIYGYGPPSYNGVIYNAGLWNAQFNGTLTVNNGAPFFNNIGTFRKSGSTGTTSIDWKFTSTGIFDVQTGSLSSSTWVGTNILNGTYTGSATINSGVSMTVASNAVLNWNAGEIDGGLTVAQDGMLNITNSTSYYIFGSLTNNGTINWSAGSIFGYGPPSYSGLIYNAGLWNAQVDGSINVNNGTPAFINVGTFKKSKGNGGTTIIGWNFTNTVGILDAQTNTISLSGSYDLTGGTLNFGLNSLTNFGKIQLSGSPATLTGTVSANLNNGYMPSTSNSFPVLTYNSRSGTFTNLVSPFPIALASNYGGTIFSLVVLNVRPTLNAISPQNLNELTTLSINATATDPDVSQSLTYALISGPANLNVSSVGAITWTPDEAQGPSSNLVVLQVTDNGTPALSATNSFAVTVNEINVAPQLTVPTNQVLNELTTLSVAASASDSDLPTNSLSYSLVSPPTGLTINTNTGAISWTPTEAQGPGSYLIMVVVTDLNTNAVNQQSFSVTNSFTVTVNEVNLAPSLTVPSNQTINEQTALNVNATALDSDFPANPLTFALVSGPTGLNVAANGNITWTPTEAQGAGVYTIFVKVSDTNSTAVNAKSLSATNSFQITVNEVNVPPVLTLPANTNINEQTVYSASATATDTDEPTNTLTFALISGPGGLTVSTSGAISWTPLESQGPSTNLVTISVRDTNSTAINSTSFSVTNSYQIIVNEVNVAPVLGALTNRTVNPGQTISFTATASDTDSPTNVLTFSLVSPPAGASIVGNTGSFSWRPTVSQANTTNTVQVRATDNGTPPLSDTKSFTVIVNPIAPVILTPLGYTAGAFKLNVAGTTGPDYIISASTNLIQWSDLVTNLSPAVPFQFTNASSFNTRFYRVRMSP